MTQRGWRTILVLALGTGLLSGCNPFALTNTSLLSQDHLKQKKAEEDPKVNPQLPPVNTTELPPPPIMDLESPRRTTPAAPPAPTQLVEGPVRPNPDRVPALPVNAKVEPPPPPEPEVVEALRQLVKHRPDEAKVVLAHYDSPNREILCALLNIAGRVHEKGLDGLDTQEICTIQDSMRALSLSFLAKAPLCIGRMFFFESGRTGEIRPLQTGHVFRAGFQERPGELVQIHAEFRNLACKPGENNRYETHVLCTAEIHEANAKGGTPLRKLELTQGAVVKLVSAAPRTDYEQNFAFYMPDLPAGHLVLTLTLHDLTRPEHPRVIRRSLDFCVNNQ
jgi:hypothetical protein